MVCCSLNQVESADFGMANTNMLSASFTFWRDLEGFLLKIVLKITGKSK